jgi:hypothetical protein
VTNVDPPPSPPYGIKPRKRLDIEQPIGAGIRFGPVLLYGLLVIALAGAAIYGAAIAHYPLTSGYVAAPAIGALWFTVRVFMMLNSRK